jgi:uncharacterized protein YbjT (DUF2867 family)
VIVVAGGTGLLGTLLVRRLAEQGLAVRILTRDPHRAVQLVGEGVEAVRGDVRDADRLKDAMVGATTVVSAMHGFAGVDGVSPASVDHDGNFHLIEAASRVGAAFVLMSVVGAAADHPMELFRAKHAAEERLRGSEVPWTIVRATAFIETWAGIMAGPLRARGTIPVFGRGANPINFVSARDVAALVALAITEPSLRGRVLELGGPDNVTFNELAARVQEVTGLHGRVRHIPRSVLRLMSVLATPVKPAFARQARAAVFMDTVDMTFDPRPARREFPILANTDIAAALRALLLPVGGGMYAARR